MSGQRKILLFEITRAIELEQEYLVNGYHQEAKIYARLAAKINLMILREASTRRRKEAKK